MDGHYYTKEQIGGRRISLGTSTLNRLLPVRAILGILKTCLFYFVRVVAVVAVLIVFVV